MLDGFVCCARHPISSRLPPNKKRRYYVCAKSVHQLLWCTERERERDTEPPLPPLSPPPSPTVSNTNYQSTSQSLADGSRCSIVWYSRYKDRNFANAIAAILYCMQLLLSKRHKAHSFVRLLWDDSALAHSRHKILQDVRNAFAICVCVFSSLSICLELWNVNSVGRMAWRCCEPARRMRRPERMNEPAIWHEFMRTMVSRSKARTYKYDWLCMLDAHTQSLSSLARYFRYFQLWSCRL